MTNPVYESLEKVRMMIAPQSTTNYRLDAGVGGGSGEDKRGMAEGYIAYAALNAPKRKGFNKTHYKFAIDTYIDLVSSNELRLFLNANQRIVKKLMGTKKRQYRHRAAIVRIAMHQVFRGEMTDTMCASNMQGRNAKTGKEGISRQVYTATYKPYVDKLVDEIREHLVIADELVGEAKEIGKLD